MLYAGFRDGSDGKRLPAMRETRVRFLGQEDPLEDGMSNILAWRIPRTEEPGWLSSIGLQRVGQGGSNLAHTHFDAIIFKYS